MNVAASTALYNFLHNRASGGAVFMVSKVADANPDIQMMFIGNNNNTNTNVGFQVRYDDRSSVTPAADNAVRMAATRGVSGATASTCDITSANNFFPPQQFNTLISIFDPNNGTADDRIKYSNNFASLNMGNIRTALPSTANASFDMTIARLASTSDNFFKGDISEIFIAENQPTSGQLTRTENYLTYKYGTFPI
jgi:hypothetical protein